MWTRTAPAWAQPADPSDERLVERLAPVARELARQAFPRGITFRQLRGAARRAGILTGHESPAALRCLPEAMKRAGLSRARYRRPVFRLLPPLNASDHAS